MIKLIKKTQQDYIAAKLQGQNAHWCEFGEGVLLALTSTSLCYIPNDLLHVKLDEAENVPGLEHFGREGDGNLPAEYKGTNADGLVIFAAGEKEVFAQQKLAKPFLAVKDVMIKIKDGKSPIRFYTAGGSFLGLVMPMRKKGARI